MDTQDDKINNAAARALEYLKEREREEEELRRQGFEVVYAVSVQRIVRPKQ